ncbi:hypothetical protein [Wolbachia pipientis]|uniref:hypothetical protein n=1 Tax=Wolbachia pipientis TaxID=955 RepID=UPI0011D16F56|nr:hypothetical protein [Wolbachia pipientis]
MVFCGVSCILVPVIEDSTGDLRYTKWYEVQAIDRAFCVVNGEVKDPNECKIYGMVLSDMDTAVDTILENAEVSKLDKKYGLTM